MEPREETSATAEPDMEPNSMEASTFTWARPPRICPTQASAVFKSRLDIPPDPMISPARIKKGMAIRVKELMEAE